MNSQKLLILIKTLLNYLKKKFLIFLNFGRAKILIVFLLAIKIHNIDFLFSLCYFILNILWTIYLTKIFIV